MKSNIISKFYRYSIVSAVIVFLVPMVIPFHWIKPLLDGLSPDQDFSLLTDSTMVIFRALILAIVIVLLSSINGKKGWVNLYVLMLAFLFSIISSAQILGFFKIYRFVFVLPFVICLTSLLFWLLNKSWMPHFNASVFHDDTSTSFVDYCFWTAGTLFLVFLILAPLIIWPYSQANRILAWDVGIYHLPKALELANTGSVWDMTISYGEYPFGYESLFAFAVLVNNNGMLFGAMHALGALFFVLTFWLLLCKYTRLPVGFNFFIVMCLLISGLFWVDNINNIWWIYRVVLYDTIGKNDLFLAAGILAIILHIPVDLKSNIHSWNLQGMALTTMIALSVKPNAVLVIVLSWALALFLYFQGVTKNSILPKMRKLFPYAIMILPGSLWLWRNLIAQGEIFSPTVLRLQNQSILSNLADPKLYTGLSPAMVATLCVLILSFFITLRHKRMTWIFWTVFFVLFVNFISTPASGFTHPSDATVNFSWRFGLALLTFMFIAIIVGMEPWLKRFFTWLSHKPGIIHLILFLLITGLAISTVWNYRWYFWPELRNSIVLEDPYRKPVGTGGYNSAFDYIHKNVRYSIVWIENGLPFYLYGPGFTNSISRVESPDYFVFLRTKWNQGSPSDYPPNLSSKDWKEEWQLVYEDSEGRVYKQK